MSDLKIIRQVVARTFQAGRWLTVGKWYIQSFSDEDLYFLAKAQQKNGGWSGIQVTRRKGTKAKPKAKKSSVPKAYADLWKEVSDVPEEILDAAKEA